MGNFYFKEYRHECSTEPQNSVGNIFWVGENIRLIYVKFVKKIEEVDA